MGHSYDRHPIRLGPRCYTDADVDAVLAEAARANDVSRAKCRCLLEALSR